VTIPADKKIILFDGVCNLCNGAVQFILKRDKKDQFVFGSLQGSAGQAFLRQQSLPTIGFDSFILLDNGKVYTQSTAALKVLNYLGRGWQLLYAFMIVPPFIRNGIYNLVAKNRYRWFGKREACMVPEPRWTQRFLD